MKRIAKEPVDKNRISFRTKLLMLYMLSLPFGALNIPIGGSMLKYIAILPTAANFLYFLKSKNRRFQSIHLWYIFYVILIYVSVLYTISIEDTMQRFITNLFFVVLLLTSTICPYNEFEVLLIKKSYVWSARVTAFFVIILGIVIGGLRGRITINSGSFKEDPNYLCGYFMFAIIFIFDCIISNSKKSYKKRIALILELIIYIYIIFLTGSRGGLIGIVIGIVVYLLLKFINDKKRIKLLLTLVTMSILLYFITNFIITLLPEVVKERYSINSVVESRGTHRFDLWETGITIFCDSNQLRQVFGYGPGTIQSINVGHIHMTNVSHNLWLELLLEQGVIGVTVFFFIIVKCFFSAFRKKDIVSAAVLIGFMGMSMSLSIYAYKPLWNLIIIICLYYIKKLK